MAQESRNTEEMEMGCHERPVPCANNCGFFGNRATMDLCSKCYTSVAMATSAAANPHCPSSSLSSSSSSSVRVVEITAGVATAGHGDAVPVLVASPPRTVAPPTAAAPTRCLSCRKRVGLTGFKCRCGDIFCSTHRYSDRHDCSFDYQAMARASIAKANPLVIASKINKI